MISAGGVGVYVKSVWIELVALFLLHKRAQVIDKSLIGLYRDDGLALLRNTSCTEMKKFRKTVVKIFK